MSKDIEWMVPAVYGDMYQADSREISTCHHLHSHLHPHLHDSSQPLSV